MRPCNAVQHDVVILSDLRRPGTPASILEEVTAAHLAGYRTGLLHVNGPLVRRRLPLHPQLVAAVRDGRADLLVDGEPVRTRLLVVRDSSALLAAEQLPPVQAKQVLVVPDAGPADAGATVHPDRERVAAIVRDRFGTDPLWTQGRAGGIDLDGLIGPPAASGEGARRTPATPSDPPGRSRPRVLMVSSNGAGMGHLTRLLAYARRLKDADPWFLSLSQAVPVVGRWGYPWEYLPSASTLGMPTRRWHAMYAERLAETIERVQPSVVVFDGTMPYTGTEVVRAAHPGVRWVWSRRGMWRAGVNEQVLERASWFDAVVEPGDLAEPYDRGATTGAPAHRVGPVTLLDADEADDRDTARAALGLPADGPLALVSLGAGTINDIGADVAAAAAALGSLGVGVCVTQPELAGRAAGPREVRLVHDYPLARRYAAFDVVVSACGYNSVHELLRHAVPALLVPNAGTALDDQQARARYAADQGWAHTLPTLSANSAEPLLADLLERGPRMVAGAVAADPGNGAAAAAALIEQEVLDG